jgi:outer membrane protein assembly factor BamB
VQDKNRKLTIVGLLGSILVLGAVVMSNLIGSDEETSSKTSFNGKAEAVLTDPKQLLNGEKIEVKQDIIPEWQSLWVADFKGNRIIGFNRQGAEIWQQQMASAPIPAKSYNTHTEYVTVAPNGNLIVSDGEGMMVQEIDRSSHNLLWQYGIKDKQGSADGLLHQPDKAYKINDHEVLVNDGNNRRVIIIDQRDNKIVWQYGETLRMGKGPGLLRGNTAAVPVDGGQKIGIVDTLEKKIIVVDRATKSIVWEWTKSDAKWLQHAWPIDGGGFVMEDRQKHDVFAVNAAGQIMWQLNKLADGSYLKYPTDVRGLANGNVLIAEAGRGRVIEVVPMTGEIVSTFSGVGFVTTIDIQ